MAAVIGKRTASRMATRFAQQQRAVMAPFARMKSSQAVEFDDGMFGAGPGPLTVLTEEEEMFKSTVSKFATDVVLPRVTEMDRTGTLDPVITKGLFENGLMSVEIPAEYGGSEASFMSLCLTIEELSKIEPSVGLLVDLQNTVVNTVIQLYASEAQKEEYLPRLGTDLVGSFCLSEAGSGSDAFSLKTRADVSADGSYYTLNGEKMWISNAEYAGVFVVLATVDPSKGHRGITCFLIDRDTEGLSIGQPEDKLGIRASSTCTITLNDVKVKKENILGEVGKGYMIAISQLNESRIGIAAQMLGLAQGVYDQTIPYLFDRHQFGTAIGDFQVMQHQQAEAALDLETARLLVYNAARLKDAGLPVVKQASMAKLHAARVAEKTASKCIEWLGGIGFTKYLHAEKFYRDAKIGPIYGGTANMQLSTIAKIIKDEYKNECLKRNEQHAGIKSHPLAPMAKKQPPAPASDADPSEHSRVSESPSSPAARPRKNKHAPSATNGSVAQDDDHARARATSDDASDDSSVLSSPSHREKQPHRPRFDSKASWADSTRFDMGRADSRASDLSPRDLRLTTLSKNHRNRADSRASSRLSQSSRGSNRPRNSSFVSNFGATKPRKGSNALSTITEHWNLPEDEFGSPFSAFDAQEQPIREQLERGMAIINDHTSKLKEIEDAVTAAMSEVWGYWADPIQLYLHPAERVDVQDLIHTDNELFNKVLTVFAVLCDEISELKVTVEDNFYPALIMFGHSYNGDSDRSAKPGEDEVYVGRMLTFFQDISNFVDRCNAITINILHQLASLYQSFQKLWKSTFKLVHLHPVFDALASLLEVMVTIDAIVIDNPHIVNSWDKYKRMMQYVRADPARYNVTVDKVKQFERLLVSLDQTIMSAQVFQTCIEQDFEAFGSGEYGDEEDDQDDDGQSGRASSDLESRIDIRSNRVFLEEFLHCISARLSQAEKNINTPTETYERDSLVGTAGLYVLLRRLLPSSVPADPNLYKRLWESQLKTPAVTICGKISWFMPDFLLRYAPMSSKKLQPADIVQFRREYLHTLDQAFPGDVAAAKIDLSAWLVRMESFFQPTTRGTGDPSRTLSIRGNLIIKGLILAKKVQTMMHTLVNLHLSLDIPMSKRVVRPLYTCIEILKAVEFMFARKNPILAESCSLVLRQVAHSLFSYFRPVKARLEASKRFDDTKLDVLAAVTVIEETLHSGESFSYTRLTILDLATQIALISPDGTASSVNGESGGGFVELKDADEPIKLIWKMRLLSDFQRRISNVCDCSFFYWSRELLHPFMQDLYGQPEHCNQLQYIVSGFLDAVRLVRGAQHEENNDGYIKAFAEFIDTVMEEEIVDNLCKDVENDLRLHIHSVHLDHMDAPNPKSEDFKVLHRYLDLRPIRLYGKMLDLNQRVTHYLENTFYNLTTVALHDWKTYGEMRNLANDKYGLSLADNHLPMGSLDQGLDILQIMRNIQIFVSRYNYNLNQQFFLERRTDKGSRHLNSINIHSIASSIRTHGMGIMNTTVNFTYQFLTRKFDIFSQFLFDEYIKSYLQREKRWYKKHREDKDVDNKYPYDRAFQFNKDIRKLGVSDSGKTFLDQFRILITEIGNALGYVRMVRSAGMNYCSNAIKFVPDLNHTHFKFEAYAGEGVKEVRDEETNELIEQETVGANLSRETVIAARNLDSVISNLSKNFSENNDYFKVLVKVFQDVTTSDEQKHLVNFASILPALTINFVENMVQAKDLMYKNTRRRESYFTDDGFAIGVAYILAILNQGEAFDALHWFEEVSRKYEQDEALYIAKQAERDARKKEQAARKQQETTAELIDDEEEVHSLQLTAKRIELNKREFDLLDWSLNGARIFFKD